ncbi:putative quinol monooxygenase YgiN [Pseudobythopirellula maris]|uniref:Putative quinol monooxygenase YgiN n=1 Tax=Pseudobythopirellula maris TaxID=2527991 RepID=A0A5C5ZJX6_9BACT|nr:putative quinol monooxygenase [Pseudobythopirellula maris]TWT87347.1 putative quinol monooxygenase YgiN [Pseudobythopirellula maris]
MIHVIATLSTAPGRRQEVLDAFAELTPKVHAEKGCIEYGAAVDEPTGHPAQRLVGDDRFMVVEKWESPEALEAHHSAPHMVAFRDSVGDALTGVELLVLSPA